MTKQQVETDYELNTGKVIVKRFARLDPMHIPAVLVANHGPFTWGKNAAEAVENAVVLEQIAQMALGTICINPKQKKISQVLLDKHYLRKHGKNSYYGQKEYERDINSQRTSFDDAESQNSGQSSHRPRRISKRYPSKGIRKPAQTSRYKRRQYKNPRLRSAISCAV
jgi:hypothetical protein